MNGSRPSPATRRWVFGCHQHGAGCAESGQGDGRGWTGRCGATEDHTEAERRQETTRAASRARACLAPLTLAVEMHPRCPGVRFSLNRTCPSGERPSFAIHPYPRTVSFVETTQAHHRANPFVPRCACAEDGVCQQPARACSTPRRCSHTSPAHARPGAEPAHPVGKRIQLDRVAMITDAPPTPSVSGPGSWREQLLRTGGTPTVERSPSQEAGCHVSVS